MMVMRASSRGAEKTLLWLDLLCLSVEEDVGIVPYNDAEIAGALGVDLELVIDTLELGSRFGWCSRDEKGRLVIPEARTMVGGKSLPLRREGKLKAYRKKPAPPSKAPDWITPEEIADINAERAEKGLEPKTVAGMEEEDEVTALFRD